MRKLIIALALTTMLGAAGAAASALPHVGARFTGPTSAKKVNGFGDKVTFVAGAKSLKGFSFGTLGCFGYGTFPVGVDPYGTSLAQLRQSIPMTPQGVFSVTSAKVSWSGGDATTKLKVTVNGQFKSSTTATGTISIIETGANGGSCGPAKMTFNVKLGNA